MHLQSFAGTFSMSLDSIGLSFPRPLNRDRCAIDAVVDIGCVGVRAEDARHGTRSIAWQSLMQFGHRDVY